MSETWATVAEYLRLAVETETLPLSVARRWADKVVADAPLAPGDIVDVAWSNDLPALVAALHRVNGERDFELAERWFFRTLLLQMGGGRKPAEVIRAAKHALFRSSLGREVYYAASVLEDELQLAELGYVGLPAEAAEKFATFLKKYAADSVPPELQDQSSRSR
jgi:hypothetical protein